tara:strand:+ start:428 stop:649 length:222 start_codon:yes stop_codon:yes gene_type:complete
MFGTASFAEIAFSEVKESESFEFLGSLPVIYFNSDLLTFPLKINKLANIELKINKLQNYNLKINKIINFNARR